jgi:hypothetical protein
MIRPVEPPPAGLPEVLTVNGNAEVVVQEAAACQELLDRLDRAEVASTAASFPCTAAKGVPRKKPSTSVPNSIERIKQRARAHPHLRYI